MIIMTNKRQTNETHVFRIPLLRSPLVTAVEPTRCILPPPVFGLTIAGGRIKLRRPEAKALSICLPVYLSICLSVYLSICLSVCLPSAYLESLSQVLPLGQGASVALVGRASGAKHASLGHLSSVQNSRTDRGTVQSAQAASCKFQTSSRGLAASKRPRERRP